MLQRISQLIKSKKITASQFADEIGVQRSSVSHVLSGRNKPSLDFVTKIILTYPEINSDWLLTGEGKMLFEEGLIEEQVESLHDRQTNLDWSEDDNVSADLPEKEEVTRSKVTHVKKKAGSKQFTTGQKAIERIVLFYNDGTFIDFIPDN
jgi:transcriptional regulator with XRE-family HTH domain